MIEQKSHKVFVSYKYHDTNVRPVSNPKEEVTKVRDYVDILEEKIGKDNIYKGEKDGEDLSQLKEDSIWEKLKTRIKDSSVTIVLVSPCMKDDKREYYQWIPWEVRYSLKEYERDERTTHTNGLLYVVLPDHNGSYDYFVTQKQCYDCRCINLNMNIIFTIMEKNFFNRKDTLLGNCKYGTDDVRQPSDSYAIWVKWDDIIAFPNFLDIYISMAYERAQNKSLYDLGLYINKTDY